MAIGRRREHFQQDLMVPTSALPRSPGHPFYAALNKRNCSGNCTPDSRHVSASTEDGERRLDASS